MRNPIDYSTANGMLDTEQVFTNQPYYIGSNRRVQRKAQEEYVPINYGKVQAIGGDYNGNVGAYRYQNPTVGLDDVGRAFNERLKAEYKTIEQEHEIAKTYADNLLKGKYNKPVYSNSALEQVAIQYNNPAAPKPTLQQRDPSMYIPSTEIGKMGIRFKDYAENTGGGDSHVAIPLLAKGLQGIYGNRIQYVSAMNDKYHHSEAYFKRKGSRNSGVHGTGRAMDIVVADPKEAPIISADITDRLKKAGLVPKKDFIVIDEYSKPSSGSTGGHIDIRYPSEAAANKAARILKNGGLG